MSSSSHPESGTASRQAPGPARPDYTPAPPPRPEPSRPESSRPESSRPESWQPDPDGDRPLVLVLSLSVWLSSFLAGLLAVAYSLGRVEQLREALRGDVRAQRPQIAADALERVVRATLNVGLAGVSGIVLVQLLLVVVMICGYRWARVALTVAGALGVLGTAFAAVTFAERTQALLAAQVVLALGGTVLMYLPESNAWFRAQSA